MQFRLFLSVFLILGFSYSNSFAQSRIMSAEQISSEINQLKDEVGKLNAELEAKAVENQLLQSQVEASLRALKSGGSGGSALLGFLNLFLLIGLGGGFYVLYQKVQQGSGSSDSTIPVSNVQDFSAIKEEIKSLEAKVSKSLSAKSENTGVKDLEAHKLLKKQEEKVSHLENQLATVIEKNTEVVGKLELSEKAVSDLESKLTELKEQGIVASNPEEVSSETDVETEPEVKEETKSSKKKTKKEKPAAPSLFDLIDERLEAELGEQEEETADTDQIVEDEEIIDESIPTADEPVDELESILDEDIEDPLLPESDDIEIIVEKEDLPTAKKTVSEEVDKELKAETIESEEDIKAADLSISDTVDEITEAFKDDLDEDDEDLFNIDLDELEDDLDLDEEADDEIEVEIYSDEKEDTETEAVPSENLFDELMEDELPEDAEASKDQSNILESKDDDSEPESKAEEVTEVEDDLFGEDIDDLVYEISGEKKPYDQDPELVEEERDAETEDEILETTDETPVVDDDSDDTEDIEDIEEDKSESKGFKNDFWAAVDELTDEDSAESKKKETDAEEEAAEEVKLEPPPVEKTDSKKSLEAALERMRKLTGKEKEPEKAAPKSTSATVSDNNKTANSDDEESAKRSSFEPLEVSSNTKVRVEEAGKSKIADTLEERMSSLKAPETYAISSRNYPEDQEIKEDWALSLIRRGKESKRDDDIIDAINLMEPIVKTRDKKEGLAHQIMADGLYTLGLIKQEKNYLSKAIAQYKKITEKTGYDGVSMYTNWGNALIEMYYLTNKQAFLKEALSKFKVVNNIYTHAGNYHIARVFNLMGDQAIAMEWLEKSFKHNIKLPKLDTIKTEPAFKNIIVKPAFNKLVQKYKVS